MGVCRLLRFLRLMKNEFIKLSLKISTWIMVIIIVALCVGYSVMCYAMVKYSDNGMYNNNNGMNYTGEMEYLEETKPQGWEEQVESLQYLMDNQIYDGWRYTAAADMSSVKAGGKDKTTTDKVNLIKSAIENNDWKMYFQFKVDENNAIYTDTTEREIQNWGYTYSLDNNIEPAVGEWKSKVIDELALAKISAYQIESSSQSLSGDVQKEFDTLKDNMKINEYRLENNIEYSVEDIGISALMGETFSFDIWAMLGMGVQLVSTVGLIVIIIAGGIVASEFSSGTIKFLLINPVKRGKILASKYAVVISITFILLLLMYIIFALMGGVLSGFENVGASNLSVINGKVVEMSGFLFMAKTYLLASINMIVMATLAFTISSLMRSSAVAIGVSIFAMMGGSIIDSILSQVLKVDWGRYLIFSNIDLVNIAQGNSIYEGQTLGFAIAVLAVHMVVFLLAAWDGFVRREV